MTEVTQSTDFVALASGYAGFLFALGGVGITILTLVLTIGQEHRNENYAGLVSTVVLFVLSCFAGAHLMTEAGALVDFTRAGQTLHKASDLARTYFVLSETNIFVAASLLVAILVLLPLTYETKETAPLRPLLFGMGAMFMVSVLLWQYSAVIYLGQPTMVAVGSSGLTVFMGRLGWISARQGYHVWPFLLTALTCIATEAAVAIGMQGLHAVGLFDTAFLCIATPLGVGAVSGVCGFGAWARLRNVTNVTQARS